SEILMRAFILRRLELIRQGWSNLLILGSQHSAHTLEIREFLGRNGHPYTYIDLDRDQTSQELLDRFDVKPTSVQALKFGAQILIARSVLGLNCARRPYLVKLDAGEALATRTIVIATGGAV